MVSFQFITVRSAIVLFWVGVISLFLYAPSFLNFGPAERSITILTWTDMIDLDFLEDFEKETGIKVYLNYFESNEELYVKLQATKGEGYDLITPSDYVMRFLIQDGLLKKIDKNKITIWDRLDPRLLDIYFDPNNDYSIPYYWSVYGIGINKEFYKDVTPEPSWGLMFDRSLVPTEVAMLNTPREACLIVAQYMLGGIDGITNENLPTIFNTLRTQKNWVEAYTETRADALVATKAACAAIIATPFMMRAMESYPELDFLIPKEGAFIVIDNFAIPVGSKKEELTYQLINYLYSKKAIAHSFNTFTFLPATVDLRELLEERKVAPALIKAHFDDSVKLDYFRNVVPDEIFNDFWIILKSN